MSIPRRASESGLKKRRRYSFLSLFTKWTLPIHGATSTFPNGLGVLLGTLMGADRGMACSFAVAGAAVATVILLFKSYGFPRGRKLGSARSPCRLGRSQRSVRVYPFFRLS